MENTYFYKGGCLNSKLYRKFGLLGIIALISVYLSYFLFIGFDTKDTFFALSLCETEFSFKFLLTSIFLKFLKFLCLDSYTFFYILTITLNIGLLLIVLLQNNRNIVFVLFGISLYAFTGIFGYDALSIIPTALIIHFMRRRDIFLAAIFLFLAILIKITSVILIVPLLYFLVTNTRRFILIVVFLFTILGFAYDQLIGSFFYVLEIYAFQAVMIVLIATFILFFKNKFFKNQNKFNFFLFLTPPCFYFFISEKSILMFTIIIGIVCGLLIEFVINNENSKKWNVFVYLVFLLSYAGSDLGFVKSLYVLVILGYLDFDDNLDLSSTIRTLFFVLMSLLILKPISYNFGQLGEWRLIINCIFNYDRDESENLELLSDPKHGSFIVNNHVIKRIGTVDSIVKKVGIDNVTFIGQESSYFTLRYRQLPTGLYFGKKLNDITSNYIIDKKEIPLNNYHSVQLFEDLYIGVRKH